MCRLLSTLAGTDAFQYPLTVCHRDRPDFLIKSGKMKIGAEVTEAIPEGWARCKAINIARPGLMFHQLLRPGAANLRLAQVKSIANGTTRGDGWAGDEPERQWADWIMWTFAVKREKLANPCFARFGQNWLCIYDNLSLPPVRIEDALRYLWSLLQDRWSLSPSFETLFVEHGSVIAEITPSGSDILSINDLWQPAD
jgi:hypothetical protein